MTLCPARGEGGEIVNDAKGAAKTWTSAEVPFVSPSESVTVRPTVYPPNVPNVCCAIDETETVRLEPSPQSHA